MASKVKVIRLLSGEEILGEVEQDKKGGVYKVSNLCQVVTSYTDADAATANVGIAPYMPYADISEGIEIHDNYVGFIVEPVTALMNEYNKIFGSGLIVPDSGIQTPTQGKFVKA